MLILVAIRRPRSEPQTVPEIDLFPDDVRIPLLENVKRRMQSSVCVCFSLFALVEFGMQACIRVLILTVSLSV